MSSSSPVAVPERLEGPGVSTLSKLFESPERRTLVVCLLLTIVVLLSYNSVTHNGFLNYDDDQYITHNPHVRAGLTWATVKWAFTTFHDANWHPLTWLSHALDYQLFGLNPAGHHYFSVLLHAINAVLLFLLLQYATGSFWRSLMVAALFALHPMNVESVAWAAERKNVLSMLFFLLALYAYIWYSRRPEVHRYAAVAFFFALALLAKPQVITFPLLLCLFDYWPLCRIGGPATAGLATNGDSPKFRIGWLLLEKLPLLLLSAASAVVTMKAQATAGAIQAQYSVLLRLETAVISYAEYLGKALWPSKLVVLYPHPTQLYPAWQVGACVVLLVLVTALVLRARNQPYLVVGWLWFLGSLVPMIGLVQVGRQSIADRYVYIPFVGLFLMLTWLAADWARARQIRTLWLAIPAVSCVLVLGALTYRQVGYWHDIPSLWLHTLALTQDNYIAHDTLGEYLSSQDRADEAAAQFRASLVILPNDPLANLNLGNYENSRGNLPGAIERYQVVALHAADPTVLAAAYGNLGSAYREMGESVKAKQCFETALRWAPGQPMSMIGLGLIAEKNGDFAEAVRQYARAMAVQTTDVGYLLLAQALQEQGQLDQAKAISERVARFSPNLAEAQKTAELLRITASPKPGQALP